MTTEIEYQQFAKWVLGDRVGMSSKCLAARMLRIETANDFHPSDGGDFGRCEALLDAVPSWRHRLGEMADVSPYWAALVAHWEEIRKSEDRYEAIKAITRPIEEKDSSVVRFSDTVSMRFGK